MKEKSPMRFRLAGLLLVASPLFGGSAEAGSIPPGRQHVLTIDGESTVTFIPQMNLPVFKSDYKGKFEYIVDSRYGKEPKPASTENPAKDKDQEKGDEDEATTKPVAKPTTSSKKSKARAKAEAPGSKATGAIDVSLHSSQRLFRQNGEIIADLAVNRSTFAGKLRFEMPYLKVKLNEAPLPIQEIMKGFDVISASILLNDDLKVVNRKYRTEGPQRALTETMLSIHAPVPRNADSWESPTQLVMGQGQTAKGILRFVKEKPPVMAKDKDKDKDKEKEKDKDKDKEKVKESTLVKVKVSGILKAEGAIAGRFIKSGTFTVTGEQTFDMRTHDWINSHWSVVVDNELANPAGLTIAQVKGTMTVQSRLFEGQKVEANEGMNPPGTSVPKP
jgi:hypothetical protein